MQRDERSTLESPISLGKDALPDTGPIHLPANPAFEQDSEYTERAIPIRPSDLVRSLASDPGLSDDERARFLEFARILGAVFHYEYYDWLVQLKDLYSPLDPDTDCVYMGD